MPSDVAQGQPPTYGTFNYADESAGAAYQFNAAPRGLSRAALQPHRSLAARTSNGHTFNFFSPWQINEDGTEAETLNHIGRQEFGIYSDPSFNDDPNLTYLPGGTHANQYQLRGDGGLLHIKESPATPGLYYATNAHEFGTHAAGQIISITGAPTLNADQMVVTPITHPDTVSADDTPSANHSGLYRDPLPLADGSVVVAHTAETRQDANTGTTATPGSRYDFRLKLLAAAGNGYQSAGQPLTSGIVKTLSYWDPDTLVSYSGPMWELNPVEVRARTKPARLTAPLPAPELAAFAAAGVDPATFKAYLAQHNLALAVTRNVTSRDNADRQQPFNLRVAGGVQKTGAAGKIYDVAFMQFFQADLLRGKGLNSSGGTPRHRPARAGPADARLDRADAQLGARRNAGRQRDDRRRWLDGSVRACAPRHELADDRQRWDAGCARAPVGHIPARRGARVRLVPRPEQHRSGRSCRAGEYARCAVPAAAILEIAAQYQARACFLPLTRR